MEIKQKGFTLVEVMLAIAIATFISITAYMVYGKVSESANANEEAQRLWRMSKLLSDTLGVASDYSGLTNQTFVQAIAPSSGRVPALDENQIDPNNPNRILNAWKSDLILGATANGRGVVFTETNVPVAGCVKFVPIVASLAGVIRVNGITMKDSSQGINVSNLSSACGVKAIAQIDLEVYR